MRLTTRGRYAVTALLDLALQDSQHSDAVSLSDIAKRQEISISYLEQLFSKLRKKGLVVSTRGASGGYHIAKPLDQISIMTIIAAVDESVDARACEGKGNCQEGAMCLTHDLWSGLSEHIEQYLSQVTLEQLIHKRNIQAIAERQVSKVAEQTHQLDDSDNSNTQASAAMIETVNLPMNVRTTNKKPRKSAAKATNLDTNTLLPNLHQNTISGENLPA